LPGVRGQDGLPLSLRFWKAKIEERDAQATFAVGLIYGPSGCGKSSLVKAGLLPRLSDAIISVFVEATAADTDTRLKNGLRTVFPEAPPESSLVDLLIAAKRTSETKGQKTLIVVDQFEQWLHVQASVEASELAAGLRLCDGAHLQCVLLVRDDFWVAVNRFMKDVGVRISEGDNSALQAISGLSQDGRVSPIRLALFCELFKGRPWTLASIKQVGGVAGVGVKFLEETFSSQTAPAEHRHHQKAARRVLKALLPEIGVGIKGNMQSFHKLLEESGYSQRPGNFGELLQILDRKTYLITPTDPGELGEDEVSVTRPASERYYQLTHDYLVPALREWLTRKQRETRRGRAEVRLAELSSLWNAKPEKENRYLPSVWEWANIRLLTKRKDWTDPQHTMMRAADRFHGVRTAVVLLGLGLLTWGGMEVYARARTAALMQQLETADIENVPAIVNQIEGYRRRAEPWLKRVINGSKPDSPEYLRASLALLPGDATQVDYLYGRLLSAYSNPTELPVLREALRPHRTQLTPKLWSALGAAKADDASVLPAASALAVYDPENPRWAEASGKVSQALVSVHSVYLGPWLDALRPARAKLIPPLAAMFRDNQLPPNLRSEATDILADYAKDDPDRLVELLLTADHTAYSILFPTVQRQAARILPVLEAELAPKENDPWNDPPLDPSWTKPDGSIFEAIESAGGLVNDRFALCQTMSLGDFLGVSEVLRKSGYRPVRLRPYADGPVVRVAAVWNRDGRNWRIEPGVTAEQIRQQDEKNRSEKFLPVDVAGYAATDKDGKPAEHYAALWVESSRAEEEGEVEVTDNFVDHQAMYGRLKASGMIPVTMQVMWRNDGRVHYCGIWQTAGTQEVPPHGENLG